MLRTGYLDLTDIKKNAGLVSFYDTALNAEYGSDGITTVIYKGKLYEATKTKGNMGTDAPDANANWADIIKTSTPPDEVKGTAVVTTNADINPTDPIKIQITDAGAVSILNDTTAVSNSVNPLVVVDSAKIADIPNGKNLVDICDVEYRINNVTVGKETVTQDASSDATKLIVLMHLDSVTTATIPSGTKIAISYIGKRA